MMTQSTRNVPQPWWQLLYNGKDVTQKSVSIVSEARWVDRLSGEAPEVSLTMVDPHHILQQSTPPQLGDEISLSIGYAGAPVLSCGTFTVDEVELTFPPDLLKLKAVEAWVTAPLKTPTSQSFEGNTVLEIAQAIAAKHGWNVIAAPGTDASNVSWNRKTQNLETDLQFLQRIADEHGYEFQVRPPNIVFYSRKALEAQAPGDAVITRGMVRTGRFHYQALADMTYEGAEHSYMNANEKALQGAQAQVVGSPPVTKNSMNYISRVENNQQASVVAAAQLHAQNMQQFQGELTMPGTIAYRAGQTVQLPQKGFGFYSGIYLIEEAEHTLRAGQGGYTTKLSLRTAGPDSEIGPSGAPAASG